MRAFSKLLLISFYMFYFSIYIGFYFHRSLNPVLFGYSMVYVFFLVFMFAPFFIPPFFLYLKKRLGSWRSVLYIMVPAVIISLLLYLIASTRYYYKQLHLFDPYLQAHSRSFDNYPTLVKNRGTYRILILGGSTSLGYPDILRKKLVGKCGPDKIEILKGASGWYTTKHSLINYVTYAQDWNPDLIILMHGINDLSRSFSPPRYAVGRYNDRWTHFYGPAINGTRPPVFEHRIWELLGESWLSSLRTREVDYSLDKYASIKVFEKNLIKIVKCSRNNGSKIILLTQPSFYRDSMTLKEKDKLVFQKFMFRTRKDYFHIEIPTINSLNKALLAVNDITRKVAEKEGALLIDAAPFLEKNSDNFVDDCHYTKRGEMLFADMVAKTIIKSGIIR